MKADTDAIKVLVIDDETGIREGSTRILSRMGCSVSGAANGEEGLNVLAQKRIHIVLLDLKMPGMDGMEVLRRIQADQPDILVIVITGFATVETAIEAMKQGAYDFIPKPFEPDQLRIVINRASFAASSWSMIFSLARLMTMRSWSGSKGLGMKS